jgi:hypothetical protein
LAQAIESNQQTLQRNEKDLVTAKDLAGKAEAQIKSAKAQIARDIPAAQRVGSQIKADEEELRRLVAGFHSTSGTPQKLAQKIGE